MGGQRGRARRGMTWARLCSLALRLPGVTEGTSYGTPAIHVRKKLIARLKEDSETVAVRVALDDRDVLLDLDPEAFFVTDHYRGYPAMLVRLREAQPALLARLIEDAWRIQAPRHIIRQRAAG